MCSYRKEKFNENTLDQFMCKEFRSYGCFVDQNKMRKQRFNRAKMSIKKEDISFYSERALTVLKQFENIKHKFR